MCSVSDGILSSFPEGWLIKPLIPTSYLIYFIAVPMETVGLFEAVIGCFHGDRGVCAGPAAPQGEMVSWI